MGLFTAVKANKAYRAQQKGDQEEAIRLYEEAFSEGLNDAKFKLAYALLIIRDGQYEKAKEFLVKNQKMPMSQEQRITMLVDYAACCFRLGDVDKGINTLEQQFRKTQTGLLYQTLGYLYVEKYDAAHRPDFAELNAAAEAARAEKAALPEENQDAEDGGATSAATAEAQTGAAADAAENAGETAEGAENAPKKELTPEEAWFEGERKAEEFIRGAVEYDDEDPVCLDNLGQFLYRVREDREGAREWFEKAIQLKDSQIDTLYFLSRYDLEEGKTAEALEKLEKAMEGRFSPLNYCGKDQIAQEIARLKGAN